MLRIEPVDEVKNINTNNHLEEAPFTATKDLVYIDKSWWAKLPIEQRINIRKNFNIKFGLCVRDKIEIKKEDRESDAFWEFYHSYINSYNLNLWVELIDDFLVSSIDLITLKRLEELSKICAFRPRHISDIDFFVPVAQNSINEYLKKHKDTGVFMKLTDKSGKYSGKIKPKFTLVEIVNEIIHNKDLVKSLMRHKEQSCLLLCPWKYEIDKHNEFRVIVNNKFVSGISQQQCYKYVNLNEIKIEKISKSILNFYNKNKNKINYNSCVLDVWVDDDSKTHLIEINPGEMWCSSGSALFNWIIDRDKLYQKKITYVRYIDIRSPKITSVKLKNSNVNSIDSFGMNSINL